MDTALAHLVSQCVNSPLPKVAVIPKSCINGCHARLSHTAHATPYAMRALKLEVYMLQVPSLRYSSLPPIKSTRHTIYTQRGTVFFNIRRFVYVKIANSPGFKKIPNYAKFDV
jgi:hypothetical protein